VTYAAETWNLMDRDTKYLMTFHRRILMKISGPVQERDGWRIRTNRELNKLIGGVNSEVYKSSKIEMVGPLT
jgi:hypothetical protein